MASPYMSQSTSQIYQDIPAIKDSPFDPGSDSAALRRALKGCCKDKNAVITILCKRTDRQRVQIVSAYKNSFGRHLLLDLKKIATGDLERVMVALVTPKFDYLAQLVRNAVKGLGTNEALLIDIICTASSMEIRALHQAYHKIYDRPMELDIANDTSFNFKKLLVSILTGRRSEDTQVNAPAVELDVNTLIAAGIKKLGTDEDIFNSILVHRSYAHLREVFQVYKAQAGEDIEKSINSEFSGDVKMGLLAIVKCAKNRAAYFAERLRDAIKGLGTNDDLLVFIVVTRADVDMVNIKGEYERMFQKTLAADITGDTSGLYRKALLTLIGGM